MRRLGGLASSDCLHKTRARRPLGERASPSLLRRIRDVDIAVVDGCHIFGRRRRHAALQLRLLLIMDIIVVRFGRVLAAVVTPKDEPFRVGGGVGVLHLGDYAAGLEKAAVDRQALHLASNDEGVFGAFIRLIWAR